MIWKNRFCDKTRNESHGETKKEEVEEREREKTFHVNSAAYLCDYETESFKVSQAITDISNPQRLFL